MCHKLFYNVFLTFLIVLCISGCGIGDAQKKLDLKEKELAQKEEELLRFDQQLKFKEQQLTRRAIKLDSLKGENDTVRLQNPKIEGAWLVTMQCTQTTCEGYAVGDTKTEQWNISYQGNKVVVNATANKKQIRTYLGLFQENSLKLSAVPPPDANTKMNIVLGFHHTNEKLMEGERIIDRGNNCRVVFSLKAEKQ